VEVPGVVAEVVLVDSVAVDSAAAVVAENGNVAAMKNLFTFILLFLLSTAVRAEYNPLRPAERKLYDTTVTERGWVLRAAYNRQEAWNYGEVGMGMCTRFQHYSVFGKGTTAASASFTFGVDMAYDTSFIYAPKLSIEGCCVIFGGRVSYGYYMQDHYSSGVVGIEGGFNFVNTLFIYGGYNFVKAKSDYSVITEGPKFSVGFNFPFGMRTVQPPKSSTHL
jgi:hypothetical protein